VIKRPLVWILGAYLTGIYLARLKLPAVAAVILMLLNALVICLMFRAGKMINKKDGFLWCMPFLILLGFLAASGQMKKPEIYNAFDQEISCDLTGRIAMIVEKPKSKALYVEKVRITLSEGGPFTCENVIVYCTDGQKQASNVNNNDADNKDTDSNVNDSDINAGNINDSNADSPPASGYLVGNEIAVRGILKKFQTASNPGQFNEQLYYQIENIDFKMEAKRITVTDAGYSRFHAVLGAVKSKLIRVYDTILSDKEAGTLIAMLLGEKYLLDDEIKKLYQENGISHVLAISGLHVSLIGLFVFGLLKRLKCPILPATFLTIFFIYSYGVLTNFSVSTNRAVVMMVIFLLSPLIGKTYDMLSSMALSALIILLQNPLQLFSAGFLLSYGAMLGIATVLPCLKRLFPSKNPVGNALLISVGAQLATAPFILYFFYQLPVYSVITNLIILPFITLLTLTSILAGILGAVYMPSGIFAVGGANYILKLYEWLCRLGSSIPGNLMTVGKPGPFRLFLYFILLALFLWTARKYQKKRTILILVAAAFFLLIPQEKAGLEVTFLDVGQGDAIYMETGNGVSYLVDGGSSDLKGVGTYRLEPFLLSAGTDELDYAIMTHSDSDHISGLSELIGNGRIAVRTLLLPYLASKDEAYARLEGLAREKKISVRYIRAGDRIRDGNIQITCLHPSPGYLAQSVNSYSTVLSVTYGDFDMLLTGDLERDGEQIITKLLQNEDYWSGYDYRPAADYDILKVAHHGSRNSTFDAFLALIKPEISIISCGKNNSYGHPHAELLERLRKAGSNTKITCETGAVTVKTDGRIMEVTEFLAD
jgi:competence protein ComEC